MIELDYIFNTKRKHPRNGVAKHCFIYRGEEVKEIAKQYGREDQDVCLKIFYNTPYGKWGDDPTKEDTHVKNTTVHDATIIQNICAWYGLAPRVYAYFSMYFNGKKVLAQLTEDLGNPDVEDSKDHNKAIEFYKKIDELGKQFGFKGHWFDVNAYDVVGDKFVDFQVFSFEDDWKEKVAQFYRDKTKWGKIYYQNVPEFGLKGSPRKFEIREKAMRLNSINFNDKTFADFGCSGGNFVREALKRGAKRAVGYDLPEVVEGAYVMSMALGFFNADFIRANIDTYPYSNRHKVDIAFYLSMIRHTKFPLWLNIIADLFVIEWNNGVTEDELKDWIKNNFKYSKMVGRSDDHGGKPYWWCSNKEDVYF